MRRLGATRATVASDAWLSQVSCARLRRRIHLTANHFFSLVILVIFERIARSKSVSVDGERLLLAVGQQESHGRFVCGFGCHDVSLTAATIDECEHRWSVLVVASTTTLRETTQTSLLVALAAFQPSSYVDFVDFDRANKIDGWRVERSGELLDAPPERPIGDVDFSV